MPDTVSDGVIQQCARHTPTDDILLKTDCSISIGYRKKQDSGELRNLSEVIQLEIKYRCAQPQSSPLFYDSTISKHGVLNQKIRCEE